MPDVRLVTTAAPSDDLLAEIHRLLLRAFPGDFSDADWEHARSGEHFLVVEGDVVFTHVALVPRILEVDGRPLRTGYVEAVATAPERERAGFGSLAMTAVSEVVRRDFDLGALSTDRHGFYERLGWERWEGPTFVRRGRELIRTEEEDHGVMVVRFGPSQDIDLGAPISCEARRGDDW